MKDFKQRRINAILITSFAGLLIIVTTLTYDISLKSTPFLTGWLLLIIMLLLTLYNVRKKLTYPPLFKSSTWLQVHIYTGFLSILAFFLHTRWQLPNGIFESLLYLLFLLLAGSGVLGIYLSRTIPRQLSDRGEEVIFERIPLFVRQLREQAETLVIESIQFNDSTLIADFYNSNIANYMASPRRLGLQIFSMDGTQKEIQQELKSLHRYLNDEEKNVAKELSEIINLKDSLDFHYRRQLALKAWLFVHIPTTYATLLCVIAHLILVHAFYGGLD